MVRCLAVLTFVVFLSNLAHADTILYSQNFEGGAVPGQFYGGSLLNTSSVPSALGVGNWVLYNNSGGTPQGATSNPIGLQLSGLQAYQSASVELTFLAIDSWDGLLANGFGPDYFNIQVNADVLFQAAFQNWTGTPHYTGDGTGNYGSSTPPGSIITPLSTEADYLVSYHGDMFYDIKLDGFYADVNGNLNIYFYASGAGWQGGTDESFAIDNVQITSAGGTSLPGGGGDTPEPATLLTFATGLSALLFAFRRRRSALL